MPILLKGFCPWHGPETSSPGSHCSALKYNLIRHIRNRHYDIVSPALQTQPNERENNKEVQIRPASSNQTSSYSGSDFLVEQLRSITSSSQEALTSLILDQRFSCLGAQAHQNSVSQVPLGNNNESANLPSREVCSSQSNDTSCLVSDDGKDLLSMSHDLNLPPNMALANPHNQEASLSHNNEMSSGSQQMNPHTTHSESAVLNQDGQNLSSCEMQMLPNQNLQIPIE
ncbi:hypothetical protein Pcinc_014496 [Petrolisthes cinctipes]|uniref:Uncharacterized protein n=1 Tax=Petrolisthes cinctipes TaxID=88211 RepID=A0AAE1FUY2_PETCI|nr:hypothetical protein Pcinc_014496 [Petrolisthes cinctipes]